MLKTLLSGAGAAVAVALVSLSMTGPAAALSSKECSVKYKAAQAAGKYADTKYADFRKVECGTGADPVAYANDGDQEPEPATTTTSPKGVPFPSKVDPKYASESPAKQRMHTCLDQYRANKAANKLGDLKWIQKGGGYYSLCNAKLKSA